MFIFINVMKSNNKKKLAVIQIRLDEELKIEYLKLCEEMGFNISKRIRLFIVNEINEKTNK